MKKPRMDTDGHGSAMEFIVRRDAMPGNHDQRPRYVTPGAGFTYELEKAGLMSEEKARERAKNSDVITTPAEEQARLASVARSADATRGQALKPITDKARLAATIDTEEMRMLGTHLNSHVIAFQNHGRKTMVHYLAIGIVLMEAKERLQHGEWLAWVTKYGGGLSHDSAERYINTGRYVRHISEAKFHTVRNLIEGAHHELTPDVVDKIARKTPELEGKTFRDIGVELKAIKTAKEKRHDAADAHTKATETLSDAQRREYAAHDAWIKAKAQLATLAPLSRDLSSDDFNDCIGVLETMLRGLKGEERDGETAKRRMGELATTDH